MLHHNGPTAIRYPRGAGTGAKPKEQPQLLEIGKAEIVKEGTQAALFGLGNMLELANEAACRLETMGISTAVINPRWIKPLDTETLEAFARKTKVLCTIEDHVLANGFGSAVLEHLSEAGITSPVVRIGWPDEFIEHGSVSILRKKHGLTVDAIVEKVMRALGQKE
jgi:1-deoxy-D-xylulose-5-phosphate synthase